MLLSIILIEKDSLTNMLDILAGHHTIYSPLCVCVGGGVHLIVLNVHL